MSRPFPLVTALLFPVLLLFALSAAAQGLKAGVSPDYPPLAFKRDNSIVGIEADSARALGSLLGQEITLVEMPFNRLLAALEAGEVDLLMSGLSITEEREERVMFAEPYMTIGQMAIVHRDKVASFAQPWAIYREGIRVGVEPGTTGAQFAAAELKDADVQNFANAADAFAGLRAGDIDLYIHDAPTSWELATRDDVQDLISLYHPLTEESLAWAVRKGDTALLQNINAGLAKLKANGTLRYIFNRWIPVTVEVH